MARLVTFGEDARPGRIDGDEIRVCDRQFIFVVKGQPIQAASDSQTLAN